MGRMGAGRDGLMERVRDYMERERMAETGSRIVAGVSGGADSVCLLYLLTGLAEEFGWRIAVVHVNHRIRPEAAEDARYVEKLCKALFVPFYLKETDVEGLAKEQGMSVEEAGRKARYEAFSEAAERFGADRIAVAHNRNDRAETLLFHLFRGTGLAGMGSIRPVRGNVIRPLLCLGREEIEGWLAERRIAWRIDESNVTDTYTRNRIRNHILPYARQAVCQGADIHLAQEAELLSATADYVLRMTREAMGRCVKEESRERTEIDVHAFLREDGLLQGHMLLEALKRLSGGGKDLGTSHVAAVRGLFEKQGGRRVLLPCGLEAVRSFDRVILRNPAEREERQRGQGRAEEQKDILPSREISLTGPIRECKRGEIVLPGLGFLEFSLETGGFLAPIEQKTYTKWFDYDKIESLAVRTRRPGDYLCINEELQRKSLKEYLIQERIPAWERDRIPLLADGSHILWVVGHRISSAVKVREDTKKVLRIHIRGGKEDG